MSMMNATNLVDLQKAYEWALEDLQRAHQQKLQALMEVYQQKKLILEGIEVPAELGVCQ